MGGAIAGIARPSAEGAVTRADRPQSGGQLSAALGDNDDLNRRDGTGGTEVVLAVSVSYFSSNKSTLNTLTGFAISDTAANVSSKLAVLNGDASHITLIEATGGQVTVGNGLLVADEAALNLIVGGFIIVGQAPVLSGNLNGLEVDISHINTIAELNGTITASSVTQLSDEMAVNKVVGGFAISDTEANVYSNVAALTADASHIASHRLATECYGPVQASGDQW
jgi:hypothetical protein